MPPHGTAAATTRRSVLGTTWLAAAALVALVLLVHGRTLGEGWAWCFDDARFILKNPHVASPASWTAFLTDMRTTDPHSPAGIVRPLRTLEFALDARMFGLAPRAFHAHSLAWFAAGAVVLLLLLRDVLGDLRAAFVGAALWTLHPMQTEAAQFISSRGDVAAGALTMLAVWAALRSRGWDRWCAVSLAAAAIATLYKESAVVVPLLVVIARCVGVAGRADAHRPFLRTLAGAWPWFAVAAAYLVYHSAVQVGTMSHVQTYVLGGSTAGTFATMFRGFGAYVLFALLPVRPAVDWHLVPSMSLAEPAVLGWLAVHATLLVWGFRGLTRGRPGGAAVVWFYAALLPVANWPFYLGIPTAERFLHVALAGLALAAALAFRAARRASGTASIAAGVVLVACGAISFVRAADWKSDASLWTATARVVESPRAEGYLAAEVRRDGVAALSAARGLPQGPQRDRDEAAAQHILDRALDHAHGALLAWARIEGTTRSDTFSVVEPHVNASNLCFLTGRPGEALFHADEALRIDERAGPTAHYNRALALLDLGRGAAAFGSIVRARELGLNATEEIRGLLDRSAALCESDGETEIARVALTTAARLGVPKSAKSQAALDALDSRVSRRITTLQAAAVRAPDETSRRRSSAVLAVALAADGQIAASGDAVAAAGGEPEVARFAGEMWTHARWAARATREGWEKAVDLLAGADTADALFLRARCEEELSRDEEALRDFRAVLAKLGAATDAPETDPRAAHARVAVERLERRCPVLKEGALPSRPSDH